MHIVTGIYKHRKLIAPKGMVTRPTAERVREAIFNICQFYVQNCEFLDLFAGSGAMGIEALSRGAKSATFVDHNKESVRAIRQNLENLKAENSAHVFNGNVLEFIERQAKRHKSYDIIYVDPPYDTNLGQEVLTLIDETSLLKTGGTLFIEGPKDKDFEQLPLNTLELVSSRRLGKAFLFQFVKKEKN